MHEIPVEHAGDAINGGLLESARKKEPVRPPVKTLVAAFALVSLVGACSKSAGPVVSPSSAFPSGSPSPTDGNTIPSGVIGVPTGALGSGGVFPSSSPGAGTGNITSGEIGLTISGDIQAQTKLTQLITAIYSPPPGGFALVWTAGGGNPTTVGLGGTSFVGTKPTSPTLMLTLVAIGNASASFTSTNGECNVTIDRTEPTNIAGTFECVELRGTSHVTVNVSGSFVAGG